MGVARDFYVVILCCASDFTFNILQDVGRTKSELRGAGAQLQLYTISA